MAAVFDIAWPVPMMRMHQNPGSEPETRPIAIWRPGIRDYRAVYPPSITSSEPVTNFDSSQAR